MLSSSHWKLNYRKQKQIEGVSVPKMKIVDIANSVDPDRVAQREQSTASVKFQNLFRSN